MKKKNVYIYKKKKETHDKNSGAVRASYLNANKQKIKTNALFIRL